MECYSWDAISANTLAKQKKQKKSSIEDKILPKIIVRYEWRVEWVVQNASKICI